MNIRRKYHRYHKFDYSSVGYYFITICCYEQKCLFGEISNDEMILNEFGRIAFDEWEQIPTRFNDVSLDIFQIMPNHIHWILIIKDRLFDSENIKEINNINKNHKNTIGDIIKAYKSIVFNKCLNICKSRNQYMGKLWQPNYYDHILRDSEAHYNIGNYILNNPINWSEDDYFKA